MWHSLTKDVLAKKMASTSDITVRTWPKPPLGAAAKKAPGSNQGIDWRRSE
jgi:hypothetical protein